MDCFLPESPYSIRYPAVRLQMLEKVFFRGREMK